MKCPFCNRDYLTQEEVMNCVAKHMRDSQEEQVRQVEKQNIMVMASQLTMASLASHTSARDVVQRFGEIYELLQSLTQKADVVSEIEKWLGDRDKKDGESP
jgi:ribosomal protein S3AE